LPSFTLFPASINTFFIDALMGLVNISSNSGNTSPVALRVFSTLPFSTTAVVISVFLMVDFNDVRSSHTAA
jgi:hypothetical protein